MEHRNDENLIIAQIHLAFLRLHNQLVDQGMSFDQARQTVVGAYRYVVLNDYLPQIVGQARGETRRWARTRNAGFFKPGSQDAPDDPGGVLGRGVPVRPLPSSKRLQHQRHVGRRASVLAQPHGRRICAAGVSSPEDRDKNLKT